MVQITMGEHLLQVFIGNACPWCHRVLLMLIIRNLLPSIAIVDMTDDPERASRGGWFLGGLMDVLRLTD